MALDQHDPDRRRQGPVAVALTQHRLLELRVEDRLQPLHPRRGGHQHPRLPQGAGREQPGIAHQPVSNGFYVRAVVADEHDQQAVLALQLRHLPHPEIDLPAIDQRLQYMAYRELKSAVDENDADGGVLVVVLLFIFLMNFRTTFITLTAIPLSLVITALIFAWLISPLLRRN